jgi:hypothetical protein
MREFCMRWPDWAGNNDITFGFWSDIIPRPYSCR